MTQNKDKISEIKACIRYVKFRLEILKFTGKLALLFVLKLERAGQWRHCYLLLRYM